MERHFDELLASLKLQLVKMSALAETMIADAIRVLVDRSGELIPAIQTNEEQVNRLQLTIDEACLELIALQQPTASDLRFILAAAKTNTELERLADQAVNICNAAHRLLQQPALKPCDTLAKMALVATGMLKDSLHSFVNLQVDTARMVLVRDDELDQLKTDVTEELTGFMMKDPSTVRRAMDLILVGRYLERIGDHATNIAEDTIFVVEGKDVRHHNVDEHLGQN